MANTKWFEDARFGMFIHWGLYAVHGKGEWHASIAKVSPEKYDQYFETFDPIDYNPKLWARMAKEAGMKYAVLTTKHHEGFCLFDSAYIINTETPITIPVMPLFPQTRKITRAAIADRVYFSAC